MYIKEEKGNHFLAFVTSYNEAYKMEHILKSDHIPYTKETLNRFGRVYYVKNEDFEKAMERIEQHEMELLEKKVNKMKAEVADVHGKISDKRRKAIVFRVALIGAVLLVLMRLVGLY